MCVIPSSRSRSERHKRGTPSIKSEGSVSIKAPSKQGTLLRNITNNFNSPNNKTGILIAQLGTPEAPTEKALRPFLRKFLSDPRVIEKPKIYWWFVLNCIVLRSRPARSAEAYKRIWTDGGSPLLIHTKRQTDLVTQQLKEMGLNQNGNSVEVEFGMRYAGPAQGGISLEESIDKLIAKGCDKIVLFNMYPQYSGSTSASNYGAVFKHLLTKRNIPTLKVISPYYEHPAYVRALAHTVNNYLQKLFETGNPRPEKIVLSYHGIPRAYVTNGDPYCEHCIKTTEALLPLLDYEPQKVIHTYQSRFGRDPWLEPYTDRTAEQLARDGTKHIAVFCPGFVSDCLETLDEIGNELRHRFVALAGPNSRLDLIPCLNDSPEWIDAMVEILSEEVS